MTILYRHCEIDAISSPPVHPQDMSGHESESASPLDEA
jgi:hypothetical protein